MLDNIINLILHIFAKGITALRNNIKLIIIYLVLILLIFWTRGKIYYYLFFAVFIISAIKEEIKNIIKNKKVAYYNRIFTECKLYSSEHITPIFLYEKKVKPKELNIMELSYIAVAALIIFIIYKITKRKIQIIKEQKIRKQEELRHIEEAERTELSEKQSYFRFVFEQCKLSATKDRSPLYMSELEISAEQKIIYFSSLVPLEEWKEKRLELEKYLECKIIKIEQEKNQNSDIQTLYKKIKMTVTNRPLAKMIDWNDKYINERADILNIGLGYSNIIGMNLEVYPHAFIAGTTGSGKTNLLKCLIHQALMKNYDVILIDFKRGISFTEFEDKVKIYYEYDTTQKILTELVYETKKRLDTFREYKVDSLKKYNNIGQEKYRRKIIFIDELAELMTVSDKKTAAVFYDCLETLTRISRAAGINLIMATQRVDSTIITGQIKSNVIFRICGALPDVESSRIMLGNNMASKISPEMQGRVIVKSDDFHEVQAFYYESDISYQYSGETTNNIATTTQNEITELKKLKENLENLKENTAEPTIDFDFDEL